MTIIRTGPGASPGDVVLGPGDVLEITGPLSGQVLVRAHGTASSPAVIRPAAGRATLRGEGNVLVLLDPRHVEVRDLDVTGTDAGDGVLVWSETAGATGVRLSGLAVRGARNGIAVGSDVPGGLGNVEVAQCRVEDCLLQGILVFGPEAPRYGLRDVRVTRCLVEGTRGDPTLTDRHSGSGIVLGSVRGGEVADCRVSGNGAGCRASEGPEGIFLHDCGGVALRRCVAVENRTGGPADGGGLGIDLRCSDCVIEDCTATGNDGAGILLWNLPGLISGRATVRNNRLADNCRRTTWHGEITVAPSVRAVELTGNRLEPRPGGVGIVLGFNGGELLEVDNPVGEQASARLKVIPMHAHAATTGKGP